MYRQLIGSLMYLIHTRPDICFAVSALSQFMFEPRHKHWVAAKHVLRYLRGSVAFRLRYTSSVECCFMGMRIQVGLEAWYTERVLQVTVSA